MEWYKCDNCGSILAVYSGLLDYNCNQCGADEFRHIMGAEYEEIIMELYEKWRLSK
jgi:DNA-directed RNA polymerase subunit RPC12/RpoP